MLTQFDKKSEHVQAVLFVAKAVEKKDQTKFNLLNLYCDGSRIMATDGHRLHIYTPEVCPLAEGYHRILKKSKTSIDLVKICETLQFPAVDRVIPKAEKTSYFQPAKKFNGDRLDVAPADVSDCLKLAQVLRATDGGAFDIDYFRDACGGMESYSQKDEFSPLLLSGKNILAVIMPVRG